MLIVVVAGLAAGLCFALGGVLQQQEASRRPEDESLTPGLLLQLARRPVWLAGIGLAAASYGFKSLALAFGPLSVVQPLIAAEIIFAVPLSVRRHGRRLHAREWTAAGAVALGLAIGIYAAAPQTGDPLPPAGSWVLALGAVVVIAGTAVVVGRRLRGAPRASLFALAAAALLAAQGALLSATVAQFKGGVAAGFSSWEPYAMAVAAIAGTTLVQSAYQAGPLAASMPVMDAANPAIAVSLGVVLLGESVRTGLLPLLGTGVGIALLVGGIVALDTSPLVRRVQREEQREREQAAPVEDTAPAPAA